LPKRETKKEAITAPDISMQRNKFDFWNDHSQKYLEMALNRERLGRLEHPDGYGKTTAECGDTIEVFLNIRNGRIASACFDADGCLHTIACANTVMSMAEGRTAAQAWGIKPEQVLDYLETLPLKEVHCAELAVGALRLALSDFRKNERAPWKKMYMKY